MKYSSALALATIFITPITLSSHSIRKPQIKANTFSFQQAGGVAAENGQQTGSAARRVARWRSRKAASQPVCDPASAGSVLNVHCTSPATRAGSGAHRSRRGAAAPHRQPNWVCDLRNTGSVADFVSGQGRPVTKSNMPSLAYTYNNFGEVTQEVDANGRTTRYAYDKLGRVTTKQLPLSEGTVTYTYDTNTDSDNAKGIVGVHVIAYQIELLIITNQIGGFFGACSAIKTRGLQRIGAMRSARNRSKDLVKIRARGSAATITQEGKAQEDC